ncbi:phosphotyrosyl phosphatase activator [Tirmania nivea]|nr:phosphotyrosyl phosphatase activator [Tirmania nivea]
MPLAPLHPSLHHINLSAHTFRYPEKCINSQEDLQHFRISPGYTRLTSFLNHLNSSVSPLALSQQAPGASTFAVPSVPPEKVFTNSPSIVVSPAVQRVISLIQDLENIVSECPPDTGPRRFGNVAFRKWHKLVEERIPGLLEKYLPEEITQHNPFLSGVTPVAELTIYLMGSFGSAARLDYGTGHELSFLAFLCGIWILGGFTPNQDEQAIALRVLDTYLHLIRTLVKAFTLEPAGSHGVWGLDDHSFLPYIFGSAQLTTQAPQSGVQPDYASLGIPRPSDIIKRNIVDEWRDKNLYFDAVGFIYDVKKGPFWEHSPILFDISGVTEGWGKINIGMIKMYNAEVLGKFPVVQHFQFGSLFPWTEYQEKEIEGVSTQQTYGADVHAAASINSQVTTRIPWAKPASGPPPQLGMEATARAPWPRKPAAQPNLGPMGGASGPTDEGPMTKAPWSR